MLSGEVEGEGEFLVEDEAVAGDVEVEGGGEVDEAVADDAGVYVGAVVERGAVEWLALIELRGDYCRWLSEGHARRLLASAGVEGVVHAEPSPFGTDVEPESGGMRPVVVSAVALYGHEQSGADAQAVESRGMAEIDTGIGIDDEIIDDVLVGTAVLGEGIMVHHYMSSGEEWRAVGLPLSVEDNVERLAVLGGLHLAPVEVEIDE